MRFKMNGKSSLETVRYLILDIGVCIGSISDRLFYLRHGAFSIDRVNFRSNSIQKQIKYKTNEAKEKDSARATKKSSKS